MIPSLTLLPLSINLSLHFAIRILLIYFSFSLVKEIQLICNGSVKLSLKSEENDLLSLYPH